MKPIKPLLIAYRDSASRYSSSDDMIDAMRADFYLPAIPRWRLAKFCVMARDRAARIDHN